MYRYQRYFFRSVPLVDGLLGFLGFIQFFSVLFSLQTTQNTFAAIERILVMRVFFRSTALAFSLCIFIMRNFFVRFFLAGGCMDWGFDFGFSFLFNFRKIHPWFCNVLRIGLVRFTSHLFLAIFSLFPHTNEMNTSHVLVLNHRKDETSSLENERGWVREREREQARAHAQETKVPRKVTIEWITK